MEQAGLPFEKIVFVCVHEREPGQGVCCSARGSLEIHAALKERVKALGLARKIRVSRSGCMDRCAKGINITHLGHSREGAIWRISTATTTTSDSRSFDATPPSVNPTPVGGTRYGEHRE